MEDNILEETVEFSQELFERNINENDFEVEYEAGEEDANN